jgi:glutathione S-transferase
MTHYLTIAEARQAPGLRMACLRGVPSPWTEAARGIFRVEGLACQYAARGADEPRDAIAQWAGDSSIPVVAWEREKLRTGWAEILLLAERLAAAPKLLPEDPELRAMVFGLAHEICGEMGLGWCMRLLMLQRSLGHGDGPAFPAETAAALAAKYGFAPASVREARSRVLLVLAMLDARLARAGQSFLVGDVLTAVDIYWATFANLLTPLPEDLMPAAPLIRAVYSGADADLVAAVTPRLRRHQRDVYERYLELPVPL